jgi:hypothetical protein
VSWWRAVEQLKPVPFGEFVLAMPVEQPDRSVILIKTSKQEWRDIGATVVNEITRGAPEVPEADDDITPF